MDAPSPRPRLLVVEDEPALRDMLRLALGQQGFEVQGCADVPAARRALAEARPDLLVLDWMLPGTSGLDFLRELRRGEATRELPVILLTARGEEEARVRGFAAGADDYVSKPFSPRELAARVRAVLRRAAPHAMGERLACAGLVLDPAAHRVTGHGRPLALGPTEFRLLRFLMAHPGRAFTRGQILDRVWGSAAEVEERTVDVYVRRLRRALAPTGHDRLVATVRGVGYRFAGGPEGEGGGQGLEAGA